MDKKQSGSEKKQLTLLSNNDNFMVVFAKIVTNDNQITEREQEFILSCAVIFFRHYDLDNRYLSYFKIGYYIVLKYALLFKDYRPLYDISLQIGFYPISDFLTNKNIISFESLDEGMINRSIKRRYVSSESYVETLEQNSSSTSILENLDKNVAYIAPTSYGKSSIIRDVIQKNNFPRIGIVVPTKSLLIQTYNDIRALNLDYKLILHDDMYAHNEKFIGILTQERATRLIVKHETNFDVLFIDEAHNLLERDSRSFILSRLIQLNEKANPQQKVVYLSPLIDDPDNIKLIRTADANLYKRKIKHDFKVADICLFEGDSSFIYDKFTGELYNLNQPLQFYPYIISNSKTKNFIYHNRPKKIEELSIALANHLRDVNLNEELRRIIKTLKNEVHRSFYLVSLIEKGIVYLHGKIPNVVKEYLEYKFKTIPQLKYIVANSVILEGINLPIDCLFITSSHGLGGKELTNLIGRVNRLNYVFKQENLELLLSKVHFMNSGEFNGKNDIKNKMKLLRNHSFGDEIKNPLLVKYDIDKLGLTPEVKEKRIVENAKIVEATNTVLAEVDQDSKLNLKKYLVENSIDDFYKDIDLAVEAIYQKISNYQFIEDQKVVDIVSYVFILGSENNIKDFEIERLKNQKAINYYNNFLEITQKQSLKEKINHTFEYFQIKAETNDPQLFIGTSYGEEIRYSDQYKNTEYTRPVYVDLSQKTDEKLINLAIVKIKIEEDFVSFKLNKLIMFLFDFELIPEDYYLNYVYGTEDPQLIELIRFGLNVSIVKKLSTDQQLSNLGFDQIGNLLCNANFRQYLSTQSELLQFELNKYLGGY
ncbi:MAG: DEAD/DEAH box helicase [Sphingobacteriaceae bacterium]